MSRQMGAHALRFGMAKAQDGKGDAPGRIGFVAAGPDTGAVHATIGYDVALSKHSSLLAFDSRIRNEARANATSPSMAPPAKPTPAGRACA